MHPNLTFKHDSQNTLDRKKPKETWDGSCRPSRKRAEEEDVGSDPRPAGHLVQASNLSPGNFTGHLIVMSPHFTINNPLYESIVPARPFMKRKATLSPHWLVVCLCAGSDSVSEPQVGAWKCVQEEEDLWGGVRQDGGTWSAGRDASSGGQVDDVTV